MYTRMHTHTHTNFALSSEMSGIRMMLVNVILFVQQLVCELSVNSANPPQELGIETKYRRVWLISAPIY